MRGALGSFWFWRGTVVLEVAWADTQLDKRELTVHKTTRNLMAGLKNWRAIRKSKRREMYVSAGATDPFQCLS